MPLVTSHIRALSLPGLQITNPNHRLGWFSFSSFLFPEILLVEKLQTEGTEKKGRNECSKEKDSGKRKKIRE